MDFNRALLTSMQPYGLQWGLMDFNEAVLSSMGPIDISEALWTSMPRALLTTMTSY